MAPSIVFGPRGLKAALLPWRLVVSILVVLSIWLVGMTPLVDSAGLLARYRWVVTKSASLVLDRLGILHFAHGDVIQLPGFTLSATDACLGANCLFFVVAACFLLLAVAKRRPAMLVALMFSAIGWIACGDVLSFVSLAAISQGSPPAAWIDYFPLVLMASTLALTAMLVFSTDRLLSLLRPVAVTVRDAPPEARHGDRGVDRPLRIPSQSC
jgi:hypothetical protein